MKPSIGTALGLVIVNLLINSGGRGAQATTPSASTGLNVGAGNQSIHALRVTEGIDAADLADIGAIGLPAGSSPIGLVVTNRVGLE